MKVEIWSDVVCPWCYVGKRNFDNALAGFASRDEVEVVWRSYELDPNAPGEREGDYAERLAAKYGTSVGEARSRIATMVSRAAEVGIEMNFDRSRAGNTFDAHRVLHLAGEEGAGQQHAVKEALLHATFTEGRPIGDRDTLVDIAVEAGLDKDRVREVLESDEFAQTVRADEREAMEIGVRGVPFFVFDRKYGVSGAQPPEAFAEVLGRVWREANPIEIVGNGAGMCDDGSCDI